MRSRPQATSRSRRKSARARSFLDRLRNATAERLPALGEGDDVRLSGKGFAGGALVADGRVVHLAGFQVTERE